jgi:hypothetical protein
MAWFTTGDIDAIIGTTTRTKVSPNTADFNAAEGRARRKVRSVYLSRGYSVSDAAPTELAKDLAKAQWVMDRYGLRKGLVIPQAIQDQINMLNMVLSGELPDPDASVETRDGIGGSKWTDTSTQSASGSPAVFSRGSMRRW